MKSGLSGKVVCLVSGGIDSPVAAWLMMKKGLEPVFVYFDNSPFTDETTEMRAVEVVEKLKDGFGMAFRFLVVPHGETLADILRSCPRNLTCVLCRRMMYRIAEKIALKEGAEVIVTGEIIGEHASQTVRNLLVENETLKEVTILRPLLGMNKIEVESLARKIGTFDISIKVASCCSGPPPKPRTRANLDEVHRAEECLDVSHMVESDIANIKVLKV